MNYLSRSVEAEPLAVQSIKECVAQAQPTDSVTDIINACMALPWVILYLDTCRKKNKQRAKLIFQTMSDAIREKIDGIIV